MTSPDHRRRVESICHAALDLADDARLAYVHEACGDDTVLRAEVESLLAHARGPEGFLDATGGAVAAEVLAGAAGVPARPASLAGTRLGSFDVGPLIGEGGMGQVYRARDTELGRDVALKVLPAELTADLDRLARFEREARLLAALNHPHIAAIHGVARGGGQTALVLELVEGETLAARLARTPHRLDVEPALRLARQIADALEAAHAQGIVHRDLKPANIIITPAGTVKVLDFGIAQRTPLGPGAAVTITHPATAAGHLLGTPGYLSPEQARGQAVDTRTDIWAFGCVLYEMLTGRRAFAGRSASDAIAATLEREPDWTALPPNTPWPIKRLLHRCLAKDPLTRLDQVSIARYALDESSLAPSAESLPVDASPAGRLRSAAAWLVAAVCATAAAGALAWSATRPRQAPATLELRATIALDEGTTLPRGPGMALSPDGTTIVYQGIRDGRSQLFRRRLSEGTSTHIDGTAQHFGPFFSPDGQWLGFHNGTVLKKMPAAGGQAVTIAQLSSIAGASWGEDGFIVVGTMQETGLFRLPSAGGSPEPLTTPTPEDAGNDHRWPQVLPGGRGVLFSVSTGPEDSARIVVLDARTGARKDLVTGSASARYVATGHLAYTRNGTLFVQPFDLGRLELTGPATRLADGVDEGPNGEPEYAFSDAGALVYGPGWSGGSRDRLALVDLAGQSTLTSFPPGAAAFPRFSPDGRFIALRVSGAKNNVWIYDVTREASTQATFGRYHRPVWSPDGQLTMSKGPPDRVQIVRRDAFGDVDEPLTDVGVPRNLGSWTPDGRTLFFERLGRDTGWDVFKVTAGSPVEQPVIVAQGDQWYARVSPNGRWLAYVSSEGGRSEVFVRALDGAAERRQVSVNGGAHAAWSPDGGRIYFRQGGQGGAAGARGLLWAVDVTTTPTLSIGRPVVLFNADAYAEGFDVSPDGRRFAMIEQAPTPARQQIHLVQHALRPTVSGSR